MSAHVSAWCALCNCAEKCCSLLSVRSE